MLRIEVGRHADGGFWWTVHYHDHRVTGIAGTERLAVTHATLTYWQLVL
jgi:hypothetical protein